MSIINRVEQEAQEIYTKVKTDVGNEVNAIQKEIADFIEANAGKMGTGVSDLIEQAGTGIENEISKIFTMVNADTDAAVSKIITKVMTKSGVDPITIAKVVEEVKTTLDTNALTILNAIEKAIADAVAHEADAAQSMVVSFLDALVQFLR